MARGYRKIMGSWIDEEIGRNSRQKTVDKKRARNTDTIRRFKNTTRVNFLFRKVWGLKSEVQCLN